jgi:tripartite-type tricarboxylate transporter receptor subunit TctC
MPHTIRLGATSLLCSCFIFPSWGQDSVAPFYHNKTLTIVAGTPGEGDAYARLLAQYLGRHIGGSPKVVITSMQGARGVVAANYVARAVAQDGTFIANPQAGAPIAPIILGGSASEFDAEHMNYIGSAARDVFVCIARSDGSVKSFRDAFDTEATFGGASAGGFTGYLPVVLDNVLGTKFKVVLGYQGVSGIMLALRRKEIQGMCGMPWTLLKSQYRDLLASDEIKVIAQESVLGEPELNARGVPLTISYAATSEAREILQILYSQETFAFPYLVGPSVSQQRVQELRDAFMETWRDAGLIDDATKMGISVDPVSGEDVQSLVRQVYSSDPRLLAKVSAATRRPL